jgi:uncharacterized protein (DUF433 family)
VDRTSLIASQREVRSGKPWFVGTRIAVHDVLEYLAAAMTTAEIVADFPELTAKHVRAAIEFAALRERQLAAGCTGPTVTRLPDRVSHRNRTRAGHCHPTTGAAVSSIYRTSTG